MSASHDLDGDVLGEEVGDDGLPGIGEYPAGRALGVDDPNLVAGDDVAMREARREDAEAAPADDGVDILPPDGDDGFADSEQQAVAAEPDGGTDPAVPAEVAAVHVTPE